MTERKLFAGLPEALVATLLGTGVKRRILEATARVVAANGSGEISVQQLLDEAGVARRTFYKTFKSKEDAFLRLFEIGTTMMTALIEASAGPDLPADVRLTRAVETYLDLQIHGGRLVAVLTEESRRHGSPLAPRREEVFGRLIAATSDAFEELTGERVDPVVLRTVYQGFEGMVCETHRQGRFTQRDRDRLHDAFVPILLRVLTPPGHAVPKLPTVASTVSRAQNPK